MAWFTVGCYKQLGKIKYMLTCLVHRPVWCTGLAYLSKIPY
ncbi:hypothetical protein FOXB_02088 [Fusarium oxysporum f. sp. conglutinans Fo5176]|uniref:Uncharacterized protein n=1 Tax=Fusarium oxysporum (strain Fo5176) TaxID=660025 RepID=F9F6R3_FUSOF|nr:hypothetical protein FOXB_02088 [Fusarium oxysporum f. sp. conglutinans Fo5176]